MANYTANNEEKYQIVCPYCFNEAAGGKPFSHKEVHFRAETYYANPGAIEQALGTSKIDIEMMSNAKERGKAMARYEDIASPEAVHAYFTSLLDLKGTQAQDVRGILPLMRSELFPFRTISERFHLIDSPTVTVYIPKDEGAGLVERLRSGECSRNLYRRLGQYGVSIYEQHFNALDQAGDLERLEDGSVILSNLDLYSEHTGLSLKADSGKGLFV